MADDREEVEKIEKAYNIFRECKFEECNMDLGFYERNLFIECEFKKVRFSIEGADKD